MILFCPCSAENFTRNRNFFCVASKMLFTQSTFIRATAQYKHLISNTLFLCKLKRIYVSYKYLDID